MSEPNIDVASAVVDLPKTVGSRQGNTRARGQELQKGRQEQIPLAVRTDRVEQVRKNRLMSSDFKMRSFG
jgi:hypothetical protein